MHVLINVMNFFTTMHILCTRVKRRYLQTVRWTLYWVFSSKHQLY